MKTYKQRSSATTVLRKLGIDSSNYNRFITKVDKKFEVDVEAAKESLGKPETCCGIAYEMILSGKTNKEVWDVIQPKYNLDHTKHRHYPAWYRCQMRREGKLVGWLDDVEQPLTRHMTVRYV